MNFGTRTPFSASHVAPAALLFLMLGQVGDAAAHALLTYPQPRDNLDTHKDPNGPCGVAKTNNPTTISAGSTLNVTWTETINHPGCFVFDVSTDNDVTWQQLAVLAHKTSPATPRPYTGQVQIPATATCTNCTFRMRQMMLGTDTEPCPPAVIPTGATYYSCADVTITGPAAPPDMATDASSPPVSGGGAGAVSEGCAISPIPSTGASASLLLLGLVGFGLSVRRSLRRQPARR